MFLKNKKAIEAMIHKEYRISIRVPLLIFDVTQIDRHPIAAE